MIIWLILTDATKRPIMPKKNGRKMLRRFRQGLVILAITFGLFLAVSWAIHFYYYYSWEKYWTRQKSLSFRTTLNVAGYAARWSKLFNFAMLKKPVQTRWNYYVDRWKRSRYKLYVQQPWKEIGPLLDKGRRNKYVRLKPGTRSYLFESLIKINKMGYRGPPIDKVKRRIRVLCVGGSTTFGVTTAQKDRPYPEVLQDLLGKKYEVINAGVPGHDVWMNLMELGEHFRKYLSLKPDVVVIYQGWNDYDLMLKKGRWRGREMTLAEACYHRFITTCLKRGIPVVMSSFPMKFNALSPESVKAVYRRWMRGQLNRDLPFILGVIDRQNRMKRRLAKQYGLQFADVHAVLDGKSSYFMDWVHLTQDGRKILARMMYRALKPLLPKLEAARDRAK